MKSYFQKMFPHIQFAIWFLFYFLGLFFVAEYIATSVIAKLIALALWAFGYPYSVVATTTISVRTVML